MQYAAIEKSNIPILQHSITPLSLLAVSYKSISSMKK
jgi:hypothetical protein